MRRFFAALLLLYTFTSGVLAQDLKIATVTRPPFSLVIEGKETGFSIDLWSALAKDLGQSFQIVRTADFREMLRMVEDGEVDAAVANISITAGREVVMDFTQPIFESGLQIMVDRDQSDSLTVLAAIMSRDLLIAIAIAFALLFAGGLLMWRLERKSQPYFDRPMKEAMFPSFWWALNLVVNGGFEERAPTTIFGRIFGVFLVVSSLFIVSIFVAKITAALTVDAIQSSVNSVNDLYDKQVGTIEGSTAAAFMEGRGLAFAGYPGLEELIGGFEAGELDAVVFDAPILAYYTSRSDGKARLVGPVFLRENYGIALPTGSALSERVNQSLLKLRENGTYGRIYSDWFGVPPGG
ncbi:MAG: transporter substrate-binding domain-containing protein [Paracoccaceae bacterium]